MRRLADLDPVMAYSDELGEVFLAVDRAWRIVLINETALRFGGFVREEVVGRDYWDLIPSSRDSAFGALFRSAMATGVRQETEAETRIQPGRFLRAVAMPLEDGLAISMREVTAQHVEARERQRRLEESEGRLRLALEATDLGIWDFDPRTGVLVWDAQCRAIYGVGPEASVTYEGYVAALHPADREAVLAAAARALGEGSSGVLEVEHRILRRGSGEERWVRGRGRAFFSAGNAVRLIGTVLDITERKRVEHALRENEERLRTIADNIPNGMVYQAIRERDGTVRFTYVSQAVERLHGVAPAAVAADPAVLDSQVLEEFRPRLQELRRSADGSGREISIEIPMRVPSGEVRWFHRSSAPRRLADGRVVWDGVEIDVTDRRKSEAALRESEQRLRATYEHANVGIVETDAQGRLLRVNEAICQIVGYTREELLRDTPFNLTHPDDLAADRALYARQVAGELDTYSMEKRVIRKDGRPLWTALSSSAVRGAGGEFLYAVRVTQDIDERRRAEDRRSLLINELNHRVKNTLATVQSIATQTLRGARSPRRARDDIEARLLALSRAHDVLTRENWEGANLAEVVRQALEAFRDARVRAAGPDVRLAPRTALAVAMALQELATNAAKYGALSEEGGQLEVAWELAPRDGAPVLSLRWVESGGPPVTPPVRRGFGSKLIERTLSSDLGGRVELTFAQAGVVCTFEIPLQPPRAETAQGEEGEREASALGNALVAEAGA